MGICGYDATLLYWHSFPDESTQRKKLKLDKVPSQNLPVRSHDCVLTSDAANKRLARAKLVETRKKM